MMMMMMMMMTMTMLNRYADVLFEAQGQSQVSGNNATLTRALSAESLLSHTAVASPKFCHGQFHIQHTICPF